MKKYSLIAILLIAVMMIVGCSHSAEVSKNADESLNTSFSADKTENSSSNTVVENESSTENSTTQETDAHTTTMPKEKYSTTTKKAVSHTTTEKQTQKQTTTKKQAETTTKKQTTTKKVTTTEDDWDCNVDGHSCKVGPIGWVDSYDEAAKMAMKYIAENADSGGYRVEHCYWCGKYTASITLD